MNYAPVMEPVSEGVDGLFLQADKFKTRRISASFALPISAENAAPMALLARLLVRSCREYPDITLLNRRLNDLYGAALNSAVIRVGDYQVFHLSLSALDDRYALAREPVNDSCEQLLCALLFDPYLTDGLFSKAEFESEQNLLIQAIEGRINEKRGYAISRMYENMFENEPWGIPEGGGVQAVRALTPEGVTAFWKKMLSTARVRLTVIGGQKGGLYSAVQQQMQKTGRQYTPFTPTPAAQTAGPVKNVEEPMNMAQGKLVLGFTAGTSAADGPRRMAAMRMMTDIFGGAPYSRLFTVVREQMSLCYYCAARLASVKGVLCVDSGIEVENVEKAREGILSQLEVMKQGGFEDSALEASRKGLCDMAAGVYDSAGEMEQWYLQRFFEEQPGTPEEFADWIRGMKKEDIVEAARGVKLNTVYFLKGTASVE